MLTWRERKEWYWIKIEESSYNQRKCFVLPLLPQRTLSRYVSCIPLPWNFHNHHLLESHFTAIVCFHSSQIFSYFPTNQTDRSISSVLATSLHSSRWLKMWRWKRKTTRLLHILLPPSSHPLFRVTSTTTTTTAFSILNFNLIDF